MLLLLLIMLADEPKKSPSERWEMAIAAMELRDKTKPPAKGAVFFCGSSSMVLWPLEKSYPGKKVVNRGFGGSQIIDSAHFADRIITPYQPAAIVLYAGDNDIAAGKSPETVRDDFRMFVSAVRRKLPNVPIYYLSIKPSVARWKKWELMKKANGYVRKECESGKKLGFIDITEPMLGDDGKPVAGMFGTDGLHLAPKGYQAWTAIVEKRMKADGVW